MYKGILSTVMLSGAACMFVTGILALRSDETAPRAECPQMDGDGVWTSGDLLPRKQDQSRRTTPKAMDADKDGKVSLDEFMAAAPNAAENNFNELDSNRDGVLTVEEIPVLFRRHDTHSPAIADANGDGRVSFEEAQAQERELTLEQFTNRDVNGDGMLTPEDCPSASHAASDIREPESAPSVEG